MSPAKIPTRQLGKNGPHVPAIGFGAMGLSFCYGPPPSEEERQAFLDYACESGATFWDTSDIYADSEDLIGSWFKRTGKRDQIFLASKFGIFVTPESGMGANGKPEYVRETFAKALKRFNTDYIDLYYVHRIDESTPIEHTIGAMAELVKAGKIKYLGLSECSAQTLRRAHAVHPISAVQVEYGPFALDIEKPDIGLLDACRELGVAVVAYSPLGRGMLGGKIRSLDDLDPTDTRKMGYYPRWSAENFPKNLELVDKITEVAKAKGCTPGQVTIAWILAQGEDFIPLPGTKKIQYLQENMDAYKVKLTSEEIATIREYCNKADVRGDRAAKSLNNMDYGDSAPLEK